MPDREKVVRAVETCFDSWIDKHRNMGLDLHEVERMKRDALELLKGQEPVKPYVSGKGKDFENASTWWYACGNCDNPIDPNDKYCPGCGRKVKWDD